MGWIFEGKAPLKRESTGKKKVYSLHIGYRANGRTYSEKVTDSDTANDYKFAEDVLKKRETEIRENKFFDKKKEIKIKLFDIADEFLEKYSKPLKKSYKNDVSSVKALKRLFGNKQLSEITTLDIDTFKANRIKEVARATCNRNLVCLKTIYFKANEWYDNSLRNPLSKKKKLLYDEEPRQKILFEKEIPTLISNCSSKLLPVVVVALCTGMRQSEVFNLRRADIDLESKQIHVLKTKSGKARHIAFEDIDKNGLAVLLRLCEQAKDYLFVKADKTPLEFSYIRKDFERALKNTNLTDFRFHDLRHTFASYWYAKYRDLVKLAYILGHSKTTMTERYTHTYLIRDAKPKTCDIFKIDCCMVAVSKPYEVIEAKSEFSNSLEHKELVAVAGS